MHAPLCVWRSIHPIAIGRSALALAGQLLLLRNDALPVLPQKQRHPYSHCALHLRNQSINQAITTRTHDKSINSLQGPRPPLPGRTLHEHYLAGQPPQKPIAVPLDCIEQTQQDRGCAGEQRSFCFSPWGRGWQQQQLQGTITMVHMTHITMRRPPAARTSLGEHPPSGPGLSLRLFFALSPAVLQSWCRQLKGFMFVVHLQRSWGV